MSDYCRSAKRIIDSTNTCRKNNWKPYKNRNGQCSSVYLKEFSEQPNEQQQSVVALKILC